jgi:hypothetical protein
MTQYLLALCRDYAVPIYPEQTRRVSRMTMGQAS